MTTGRNGPNGGGACKEGVGGEAVAVGLHSWLKGLFLPSANMGNCEGRLWENGASRL